ncbi:MAG: PHB depolymerase family esterase [Loktanella sp.]|nr:PHB depolymerase family esterase [Loktanella sp.]
MINSYGSSWHPATRAACSLQRATTEFATHTFSQYMHASISGPAAMTRLGLFPFSYMLERLGLSALSPAETEVSESDGLTSDFYTCAAGTRGYRTYVPKSARRSPTGLVVMLHGCKQSPEDFATGTGMNALADAHGFVVIYPEQSRGDQAQSCWNWFSQKDQRRNRGEPAIIAGLTRQTILRYGVPTDRVFIAGLSAGAAMAVILGDAYPDLYSAVGAHSGLPAGAARTFPTALAAMAGHGISFGKDGTAMRTIIFHGSADRTVRPSNSDRIAHSALTRDQEQGAAQDYDGKAGKRSFSRSTTFDADGQESVEQWTVEGLGHAWSGGQSAGSYTDSLGPDASAAMVRFFFTPAADGLDAHLTAS